jgi:hypothetical protein
VRSDSFSRLCRVRRAASLVGRGPVGATELVGGRT